MATLHNEVSLRDFHVEAAPFPPSRREGEATDVTTVQTSLVSRSKSTLVQRSKGNQTVNTGNQHKATAKQRPHKTPGFPLLLRTGLPGLRPNQGCIGDARENCARSKSRSDLPWGHHIGNGREAPDVKQGQTTLDRGLVPSEKKGAGANPRESTAPGSIRSVHLR